MPKRNKISAAEKTAKLTGIYSVRNQILAGTFLLLGIFLTWFLNRRSGEPKEALQNIQYQRNDSGSIQNYNAKGNISIQNNIYNGLEQKNDSNTLKQNKKNVSPRADDKKDAQINVTSNNQSGGQTANQIINNN